ncbi:MAG: hypothetical protein HW384_2105, partial [Dehalococcoidia bacterium]|nr:hypothetical protein [Dehalococcoidia bacterium]
SALFYAIVLKPSFKIENTPDGQLEHINPVKKLEVEVARKQRRFLETAAFTIIISGALLALNRMSQPNISPTYVIVLGSKVAVTALAVFVAFREADRNKRYTDAAKLAPSSSGRNKRYTDAAKLAPSSSGVIAGLGALAVLLAIILREIYEKSVIL